MWRVRTHDDHAEFARLVKRWEEPIRRVCARMTGDAHRGDDLKQETFLRLFQRRKDYQPTARFSTFLWRIAINLCHDDLRRRQRRPELLALEPGELAAEPLADSSTPDLRAAGAEEGEIVRQALLQLPDIYRAVLVLRHYEDLRLAKIAEILEIPEGTVNSRMAEALSRLSQLLEPQLQRESVRGISASQKRNSSFDSSHIKQVSL